MPGTIISVIIKGEQPVVRSDGSPVRDYIYVQDAARANIAIASRLMQDKGLSGEAFNISKTCPSLCCQEVVDAILKLMQRQDLSPIIEGHATRANWYSTSAPEKSAQPWAGRRNLS